MDLDQGMTWTWTWSLTILYHVDLVALYVGCGRSIVLTHKSELLKTFQFSLSLRRLLNLKQMCNISDVKVWTVQISDIKV